MTGPVIDPVKRLLIWRMGSIGDAVVALPVFHLLARQFSDADRRVLTNFPVNGNAAPLQSVLENSGLVESFFAYPIGTRSLSRIMTLRREIAEWRPDLAICLNEPRGIFSRWRDLLFLRWCGVRRIIAGPVAKAAEPEADRLAGCVAGIGAAATEDLTNWRLNLTTRELAAADALIDGWAGATAFIALSLGTKLAINEWGDDRWQEVIDGLTADQASLGLALIGGPDDFTRSEALARNWHGPVLNLCGATAPRISAAVIAKALLFMGHDSGPMHLAASVGTSSVLVFSMHNPPGIWFPFGAQHRVFYPGLSWSGGDPAIERDIAGEAGIAQIPAPRVLEACRASLAAAGDPA
jgi:heptosyltransferase III